MIRVKGKSKGQGHNTKYMHYERQLQHAWELMRVKQKKVEAENLAAWEKSSRTFLFFVGAMLTGLYGFSILMAWLCS